MRLLTPLLALLAALPLCAQPLLTGIVDGTLPGGTPKAIEIYANGRVDLSQYRIDRYSNGNTEATASVILSGIITNSFAHLTNDADAFALVFGSSGKFTNVTETGTASGNGDDVFTLVRIADETILDVVGNTIGVREGTYTDGFLYRRDETAANGNWTAADWSAPFPDTLDGLTATEIRRAVPFGSYRSGATGPTYSVIGTRDGREPDVLAAFEVRFSEPIDSGTVLTYEMGGTATEGEDYRNLVGGTITANFSLDNYQFGFRIIDDLIAEGTETITMTLTGLSDTSYALTNPSATVRLFDNEDEDLVPIGVVQGSGVTTPLSGQTVVVSGIVVADYQEEGQFGGYFIVSETGTEDGDPATSEGIFVSDASNNVSVGDRVTVTGTATELQNLTAVDVSGPGDSVVVRASALPLPDPVLLMLPFPEDSLESYEGMRVTFNQELTVAALNNLDRFGEFTVQRGGQREQFTQCNRPDEVEFALWRGSRGPGELLIDDGRSTQNTYPIVIDSVEIDALGSFRSGTVLTGLTGVVDYRFSNYRIQLTDIASQRDANERPELAPAVGGNLRVVSANVLNLFNGDGGGGGFPTPRGARTEGDYQRQLAKIVAAFVELDADIIGLVEIENDGYDDGSAIQDLVDAIADGGGRAYDFVTPADPGTDQITLGILYDPRRVTETGTAANLTTQPLFRRQRFPLAQTFRLVNGSTDFTVVVNHYRSKSCSNAEGNDADQNDGAGCYNAIRAAASRAVLAWLETDPTGVATDDQIVLGDLNSYRMEEPITAFTDAGWADAVVAAGDSTLSCGGQPSFIFGGAVGSLDYVLVSPSLAGSLTGAAAWQVNAPEPDAFDYSTRFNDSRLYNDDFYRFSDHDPIVAGFQLGTTSTYDPVAATLALRQYGSQRLVLENSVPGDTFLLLDTSGRTLGRGRTLAGNTDLPTERLKRGVYFLNVRGRTFRFVW